MGLHVTCTSWVRTLGTAIALTPPIKAAFHIAAGHSMDLIGGLTISRRRTGHASNHSDLMPNYNGNPSSGTRHASRLSMARGRWQRSACTIKLTDARWETAILTSLAGWSAPCLTNNSILPLPPTHSSPHCHAPLSLFSIYQRCRAVPLRTLPGAFLPRRKANTRARGTGLEALRPYKGTERTRRMQHRKYRRSGGCHP